MYVRSFLFLALSVLPWSNLALAEPGFWPVEHSNVPVKVRESAQFVFKVYFPLSSNHQVEYNKIEALKRELDARLQSGRISRPLYLLILQELDRCSKNDNQDYFCTVSNEHLGTGALFSLGNQQVVTALHNIAPFLRRLLKQSEIKELSASQQLRFLHGVRIPVVIEESFGQYRSVYLKINTLTQAAFQYIKDEGKTNFFQKIFTDAIVLTVEGMSLENGLAIAKSSPAFNEQLYALGFPDQTTRRFSHFNVPDADGLSLRVTIGSKREFLDFLSEVAIKEDIQDKMRALTHQEQIYVDRAHIVASDLNHGMSGGPLVNINGEVVGVTHSLIPTSTFGVDEILGNNSISVCIKYLMRSQR